MTTIFEGQGEDVDQFKRLLDEQNDWPTPFTFKFIVPKRSLDDLRASLDGYRLQTRVSRKGSYISVTLSPVMPSSDAVIGVYERVSKIDGLVAL